MSFTKKIVTTYAKSLFQSVKNLIPSKDEFEFVTIFSLKNKKFIPTVSIVGEELILLRSAIIGTPNLLNFFHNPTFAEKQKLKIILSIFPGLTGITKAFLKVLMERSHLSCLPEISDEYNRILSKFKNSTKVKIITASPLDENSGLLLLETLKKLTKSSDIILNVSYNPKLLGGLIIEYNSISIDGSFLKELSLFFSDI
jgi:F-type H+-transporting ATPase subunit delta